MNVLDWKPPLSVIIIHSTCKSCTCCFLLQAWLYGLLWDSHQGLQTQDKRGGTTTIYTPKEWWSLAPREREWPVSSLPCCAKSRGERDAQMQVERAWAAGKGWFPFPPQLAKSACQSLSWCLLKNKYPRDSWMSMMCTVFIQRDITTMRGNSDLINLQSFDLILLIKCYC